MNLAKKILIGTGIVGLTTGSVLADDTKKAVDPLTDVSQRYSQASDRIGEEFNTGVNKIVEDAKQGRHKETQYNEPIKTQPVKPYKQSNPQPEKEKRFAIEAYYEGTKRVDEHANDVPWINGVGTNFSVHSGKINFYVQAALGNLTNYSKNQHGYLRAESNMTTLGMGLGGELPIGKQGLTGSAGACRLQEKTQITGRVGNRDIDRTVSSIDYGFEAALGFYRDFAKNKRFHAEVAFEVFPKESDKKGSKRIKPRGGVSWRF